MKIALIDNYDSFTYNLVHYMEAFDAEVDVIFNDQVDLDALGQYDKLVLSPGPGLPHEAGKMPEVIARFHSEKPILGVCLGFQALIEFFGGSLYNQVEVKHGIAEFARFNSEALLFNNLPERFEVGLYHSWAANRHDFPNDLQITAESEEGVIMAFEHRTLPLAGVQFHPESILSRHGKQIVENFIFKFN